ncbi:hypothetical protein Sjap_014343 [Stephania japonica]|uniref:Uncharacterized protein n=1 Tax=Stephania japonica TaxID=461633 RepID=A0AAP0J284_9MAGN
MDGRVGAEPETLRSDSKKRSVDECVDQDRSEGSSKRVKMRDLESVFLSEELVMGFSLYVTLMGAAIESFRVELDTKIRIDFEFPALGSVLVRYLIWVSNRMHVRICNYAGDYGSGRHAKDNKDQCDTSRNEASQDTEDTAETVSDAYESVPKARDSLSLLGDAAFLSLRCGDTSSNSADANSKAEISSAHIETSGKTSFLSQPQRDATSRFPSSRGFGLNINATNTPNSVEQDPFYPYKVHTYMKSRDESECGSTTGPVEEKDSFKLWKEMKQNGFLSSSYGGIPVPNIPKQRGRKKKNDPLKTKIEIAKKEQVTRFTKIAAPSGLLNGLNPGIINHVRNRKQVHSIIEALLRSEKHENRSDTTATVHSKPGNKEAHAKEKVQDRSYDSGATRSVLAHCDEPSTIFTGSMEGRECQLSNREDETLTLKLSSAAMRSENTLLIEESANEASVSSLSVKGKSQIQDTKGRLAALRRSKKRVQAVIETELPFLISKEFSSNQVNDPNVFQSSNALSSAAGEMHRARWTALFDQMDKALTEEGKHLETQLNQIKELRLHCEQGLQCINWIDPRLKKESTQREFAVRAAAASIYSTCNLAQAKEDVSCC